MPMLFVRRSAIKAVGSNRDATTSLFIILVLATSELTTLSVDAACTCAYRLPVLHELYDATKGAQWVRPWNMAAVDAPCGFDGVTCGVSDDISSIVLSSRGLDGTLPPSLGQLNGLVRFDVSNNGLHGSSLPREFANWTSLEMIDLSSNSFSGTLPLSYSAWAALTTFRVASNHLAGALPEEYSSWTRLTEIRLWTNSFSGTLPLSFSAWVNLEIFDAGDNQLSGSLPADYAQWVQLTNFFVHENQLNGSLPSSYSSWTRLTVTWLSANSFSDSLPSSYAAWTNLETFDVGSNQLIGKLPAEYSAWTNLDSFIANTNNLSGTLPLSYSAWTNVRNVRISSNSISGIIPVQYAVWKSIQFLRLDSNMLSGSIPNLLFGGWSATILVSLRMNALTGIVPLALLALPALENLYIGLNMLTGTLPSTISTSVAFLDLQNNSGLVGTLPLRSMFTTVCGTDVCPTASLPLQYCFPLNAGELVYAATSDPLHMRTSLAPYASNCTPTAAPSSIAPTPQPSPDAAPGNLSSATSLRPSTTRSIGGAVVFVSSIVGSGGAARGAVPSLQRAMIASRLELLCLAVGVNESASDGMFSDRGDNALGFSVPVGSSSLEYAAGATIGNAVLVVAVGACLHGVALLRKYLHGKFLGAPMISIATSALQMLPSSLLPGALAAAYGTQLQPSIGAAVALMTSSTRTVQSVACGVALLVVWLAFPLYCVHLVLVACRSRDGAFGLVPITAGPRRRERPHQRIQAAFLRVQLRSLHEYWMTPSTTWEVRKFGRAKNIAVFVLEHLEPVFGAYVGRREWYFVLEWSLVAVGGVVMGAASAVAADGDACGAAEWATWCMIVIGAVQIAAMVALRPLDVRIEMASGMIVGLLTLLCLVLLLVGAVDAAEAIVNAAGILELVVMGAMLVDVIALRLDVTFAKTDSPDDHENCLPRTARSVASDARRKRVAVANAVRRRSLLGVELQPVGRMVMADADTVDSLRALVTLACAGADQLRALDAAQRKKPRT
ncbi:GP46-like surface antigen, putative [Bodo saltans]|uniref:GP46-like surface antigen, putative n=1 Tax=Bodo saltans TaxID=75058 RepID=A0A0S4KGR9_BODSA|nr:GP46-like surface antigen, putative [Bodo saltans]|eukprot:CUI14808.1 GP46-like surface antigen, putative [Bodo saltans]